MDEFPQTLNNGSLNGDRMSMDSILGKCSPSQMNIESSEPCVYNIDLEIDKKTFHFDSGHEVSYIRRSLQEDINIERKAKKLEKIWKNRGLPVDKDTLHSIASEDVFDMKALNDSLPSASKKKQGCCRFRKSCDKMEFNFGRFERKTGSSSSYASPLQGTPSSNIETTLKFHLDLLRKEVHYFKSLQKARKLAREKHGGGPVCDEQKERHEEQPHLLTKKFLSIWEGEEDDFVNYEPVDNKLEEKNYGFQMNVEFPPLLTPSSDSEKTQNMDRPSPGLSVPLNSPTKWNIDGSCKESRSASTRMFKFCSDISAQ